MGDGQLVYESSILGLAHVHFADTRKGLSADETLILLGSLDTVSQRVDWANAQLLQVTSDELQMEPQQPCQFAELPAAVSQSKSFKVWRKSLSDELYRKQRFPLLKSRNLGVYSEPGENERDFRIRIAQQAREERDRRIEQLRQKLASKLRKVEERIHRAELTVDREEQEATSAKMDSIISVGTTILRTVLGRKKLSSTSLGRVATSARYGTRHKAG